MPVTVLDPNNAVKSTRQNYARPTTPLSAPVRYGGNEFSMAQEMEIDISGQSFTITRVGGDDSGWATQKVIDFPLGHVTIVSAYVYGPVTTGANSGAASPLLVSLGSTATADATLNSTEVDILPSTSTATSPAVAIASRVGTVNAGMTTAAGTPRINGTVSALDVHLNLAQAAGGVTTGNSSVTFGTGSKIVVTYHINVAV
jgi:hypothetical protein